MLIILTFDTILFSFGAFLGKDQFFSVLKAGLIAKNIAVVVYSLTFYIYIIKFDKDELEKDETRKTFNDIFHSLTYRQKFERVIVESAKAIKLSQNRFQILAQISPVGIFQTQADGFTSYVNPKWCEISGLDYEDAIGDGWLSVVHPDDKEQIRIGWEEATKEKRMSSAEYRFINSEGKVKWVIGHAVPELDVNNNIIGYVGTITDITEIKIKEIELETAKRKAEESDKMKTAFLQNISHEIRTPMNAIIGFSGLLINEKVTHESKVEYVDIINQSCNQLLSIVDDIVNIATIESGLVRLKNHKVMLKPFLNDIITSFELKIKQKNLTLHKKLENLTDEDYIFTDKVKLNQILSNLIQNAIKYTDIGFIEIECNKNIDKIEFFVRDTGIGIDENQLEKVFDRFYQVDNSLTKKFGGAGLGLAITKAYVEIFGGEIRIMSLINTGTTVYFYIPAIN
jgi:PAS domain S-box-containing protein